MVNTTILENKIEALTRRIAALVAAVDAAQKPAFKVGKMYKLTMDVMETTDNFQEGDLVKAVAVTPKGAVFLYSETSQEGEEVPMAVIDGWMRMGVLEEV